jgi:FMN-dependent NADH-azoreductase
LSDEQQVLLSKIREHKAWLDTFDEVYIASPMHNFGVSVNLKTYLDILIQPSNIASSFIFSVSTAVAFSYSAEGPCGLMKPNRWVFVCTGGGSYLGTKKDFLTPWLNQVMSFIGILPQFAILNGTANPQFSLSDHLGAYLAPMQGAEEK